MVEDLPSNWEDHLDVVSRKRSRVRVPGVATDAEEDQWAELASGYSKVKQDDEHKRILDAYGKLGFVFAHNPDFGCYYMHTKGLEKVHRDLALKGCFTTESAGNDPGTPNCYVFLRRTALYVVRFKSQQEHASWGRTVNGERCCQYNSPVDLKTACHAVQGVWMGDKGATCHSFAMAKQLASMFGYDLPELNPDRPITFHYENAHTLVAEAAQVKGERVMGWGIGYRKLILNFDVEPATEEQHDFDAVARHVITIEREDAGWLMRPMTEHGIGSQKTM